MVIGRCDGITGAWILHSAGLVFGNASREQDSGRWTQEGFLCGGQASARPPRAGARPSCSPHLSGISGMPEIPFNWEVGGSLKGRYVVAQVDAGIVTDLQTGVNVIGGTPVKPQVRSQVSTLSLQNFNKTASRFFPWLPTEWTFMHGLPGCLYCNVLMIACICVVNTGPLWDLFPCAHWS